MFDYYHDGATWSFDIPAWSKEDAEARLNKIPWAKYVGEHYYTIKASSGGAVIAPLVCMVKNITAIVKRLVFQNKGRGADSP
jgi:hypothetical protein